MAMHDVVDDVSNNKLSGPRTPTYEGLPVGGRTRAWLWRLISRLRAATSGDEPRTRGPMGERDR